MKALVIYDSAFGNTEKVAQILGKSLSTTGEVRVLRAVEAGGEDVDQIELLVVGSPTQRFNATPAVNEFLDRLQKDSLRGVKVAAFDTRFTEDEIAKTKVLSFFVNIFGYAAEPISNKLVKKGGELICPPEGFFVAGMEGPLLEGELERASIWADEILRQI